MAYQVIARKYRPQKFSDVVGQEHVTTTLCHAIEQSRIAHAYLFCGPRGTGKTTIARIFAKCLNCTGGPKVDFEDSEDPRCQEIVEGRSIDVLEIDGASNRGIEEIRELRDTVRYAPATSKYKIYIIDEVHMLTKEAFNALLKTLEEPPSHVIFMFATTEPEKVLPTILSRCQRFDLRRIPVALMVKHLGHIARQEKVKADEPALFAIARGAEGGLRDAESALDQLISFCGDKIVEEDVLSMFGLAAQSQILGLAGAIITGDAGQVLRQVDELSRHGKDLGRLLSDLLNYFRNLLVHQVSGADGKLLDLSEAELGSIKEYAAAISTDSLIRVMEILTDAEGRFKDASSKKIFLEVTLFKAVDARNAVSIDAVLKQLNGLRSPGSQAPQGASVPVEASSPSKSKPKKTAPASQMVEFSARSEQEPALPASSPAVAAAPEPIREAPVAAATPAPVAPAPASPSSDIHQLWPELLEAVGRVSAFTRSYLLQAHPVSFTNGIFTVGVDPEFADTFELINTPKTVAMLQTKLQEFGCGEVRCKFIKAEAPNKPAAAAAAVEASPPAPARALPSAASARSAIPSSANTPKPAAKAEPVRLDPEDFKNDPLIAKALEIFKGSIVEVRA